ncbi:stressosome-associated protein Prli42 [Alkalihalobacillus sp. CinArs1]|nr:stressosome-associated protein Prli42 [Alkalihalobacillus sp. CinArs1]
MPRKTTKVVVYIMIISMLLSLFAGATAMLF